MSWEQLGGARDSGDSSFDNKIQTTLVVVHGGAGVQVIDGL